MSNPLIVEEIGSAVVIRFNRPEIRNPLSIDVLERLNSIVVELRARETVERLIFTGSGDVFASGADLREIADVDSDGARAFALRGQQLMNAIADLPLKTIAAINGLCFGGAVDLSLSCDRRVASPTVLISHPGANLGIMTGWGGTQRLPRLIGEANALEMFFTAKRVAADEALRIGLVDAVVSDPLNEALNSPN